MHLDNTELEYKNQADSENAIDYDLIKITPDVVSRLERQIVQYRGGRQLEHNGYQYRVGPRDVLSVTVYEHPELTIPAGEFRSADAAGHRVDSRGYIYFPYVGEFKVAGLTVAQIRREMAKSLASHIPNPQLDVRVAAYNSRKVTVTGNVKEPGRLPISDEAMTLVRAIGLSGGAAENADLTNVRVVRGKRHYHRNVESFFLNGTLSENMLLHGGDVVHVPDRLSNQVYVMGELKKPTSLTMNNRRMTIAEAIGLSGSTYFDSDISKVFVVRGVGKTSTLKAEVYHVDLRSVEGVVLAGRFPLKSRDVVYVTTAGLAKWERVVSKVFPFFRTIAAIDDISN